jgi:hypothetical protein
MTIPYTVYGEYNLVITPCPNKRYISVGTLRCQKCAYFISKNRETHTVQCALGGI